MVQGFTADETQRSTRLYKVQGAIQPAMQCISLTPVPSPPEPPSRKLLKLSIARILALWPCCGRCVGPVGYLPTFSFPCVLTPTAALILVKLDMWMSGLSTRCGVEYVLADPCLFYRLTRIDCSSRIYCREVSQAGITWAGVNRQVLLKYKNRATGCYYVRFFSLSHKYKLR